MYKTAAVNLTAGQKKRLLKQVKDGKSPHLRLSNTQLKRGNLKLPVTQSQLGKIQKARAVGKGLSLKISRSQIKKGGFLPLLLPGLAALGATAGGAAGIARAVTAAKARARELQELKRHNSAMEALALRRGSGIGKKKRKSKKKKPTRGKGFYLKPAYQ